MLLGILLPLCDLGYSISPICRLRRSRAQVQETVQKTMFSKAKQDERVHDQSLVIRDQCITMRSFVPLHRLHRPLWNYAACQTAQYDSDTLNSQQATDGNGNFGIPIYQAPLTCIRFIRLEKGPVSLCSFATCKTAIS